MADVPGKRSRLGLDAQLLRRLQVETMTDAAGKSQIAGSPDRPGILPAGPDFAVGRTGKEIFMPIEVTDTTFADEVLKSDTPVLVDFWAPWCAPCLKLNPILDALAEEYGDRLRFVKLNADDNPETSRAYDVQAMPTLAVFRKGELIGSVVGMRAKFTLRNELDDILAR
jgi:thioredoxin 1